MPTAHNELLSAAEVDAHIRQLADRIWQAHGTEDLIIIGIHRRGVPLARRLATLLAEHREIPVGTLDITLYHDDPRNVDISAGMAATHIPVSLDDRTVILVDDVLYTGRTVRSAIDALMDFGRMAALRLVCLVDRGHRELPIQPDFCALVRHTAPGEYLRVHLREEDGQDALYLVPQKDTLP